MRSKKQKRRTFPCPEDGCPTRFTCDACLDEHLRSIHDSSYGAVFGDVPVAWIEFCEAHAEFPIERVSAQA